jgi:hypothetical protein
MVTVAIFVALLLPAIDQSGRGQKFFAAGQEEASHQVDCQLVLEHMVRTLRHARRIEEVVTDDRIEFEVRRLDGAIRRSRYQVINLPPVPGELPASEVRYLPDRDDPSSEVVLARSVRCGFQLEEPDSTRRLRIWVEAEPRREIQGVAEAPEPFRLETALWRRSRKMLLKVGSPRVEVGE